MTASLLVLVMAVWEFPNTMTASRHLDRVNWTDTDRTQRHSECFVSITLGLHLTAPHLWLTLSLLPPPYRVYIHDDDQQADFVLWGRVRKHL